jgi:hypothetical protein
MQQTQPTDESVSAHNPRPRYIALGEDAEGGTHLYRTADETIFAFDSEGRPEYRFDIDGRPETVEDYVAHVAAERGWYDLVFGFEAFVDRLAEAV